MRICSRRSIAFAAVAKLLIGSSVGRAADYIVTASGTFGSATNLGSYFDGHTSGSLAPQLNINRLSGGTFQARYQFPSDAILTIIDPKNAFYQFDNSRMSFTFDLLDGNGVVVHHGGNAVDGAAIIANNNGSPPFSVDQVLLNATINTISNTQTPAHIYSGDPYIFSVADMNFYDYVGNGVDYINSFDIPSNPATYLAFPNKQFDVVVAFGDGDYANGVQPYQYTETDLLYNIQTFSITQVPEPTAIGIIAVPAFALRRRRFRNH